MAKKSKPLKEATGFRQMGGTEAAEVLMQRIVQILDATRKQLVRTVNTTMVEAYWLIGRELVEALQHGEQRAVYGQELIIRLAEALQARYGSGFSEANLKNFRQFYLAYPDRIRYPLDSESESGISYPMGSQSSDAEIHDRMGNAGDKPTRSSAFDPALSWSHY